MCISRDKPGYAAVTNNAKPEWLKTKSLSHSRDTSLSIGRTRGKEKNHDGSSATSFTITPHPEWTAGVPFFLELECEQPRDSIVCV